MATKPLCSIPDCGKPVAGWGWCNTHYRRWKRHGSPLANPRIRYAPICSIEGCDKPHQSHGLCSSHAHRLRRHNDPYAGRTAEGDPERYYQNVVLAYDGSECLFWPFSRTKAGYGNMQYEGSARLVHRRVCEEVNGPPPTPKHEAAHSCGNGHLACVTKLHLDWKTHAGNMADMAAHGRSNLGRRFPKSHRSRGY